MNILFIIGEFILAILLGMLIMPNILLISYKKKLFDMPDKRKVHHVPIPRLGGLSFFPVILISVCLSIGIRYYLGYPFENIQPAQTLYEFLFLIVSCMLLYLIGVADDLIGVGYRYKFLVQVISAVLLILSGNWINSLGGLFGIYAVPAWFGMPFTVLIIVYITNAINLIDGIDGLASGLSSISLFSLSIMFLLRHEYIFALLALATLGILIPFWFYNVFGNAMRGHKLFMGDTGSLTLGIILSFLIIHLSKVSPSESRMDNPDMVIAFSTLLIPLLDVVRVVIHRVRIGHNPFLPDKSHIHHKLQRTGMRIRMILLTLLCTSLLFIIMDFILIKVLNSTFILILDILLFTALQFIINWFILRHAKEIESEQKTNEKINQEQ